ncbi:hypothetical protein B0H10DRAFT_2047070 [Mycena sp. CBHHK59/15]|nr:hypothetical protein B0H10DRAFT_2047070 [Mycena sp. CBHHK59/15]
MIYSSFCVLVGYTWTHDRGYIVFLVRRWASPSLLSRRNPRSTCPSSLPLLVSLPEARMDHSSETSVDDLDSDSVSTCSRPTISVPELPDGWIKCVHLNGGVYYYCRKNDLLTMDNIYNPLTLAAILDAYHEYIQWMERVRNLYPPVSDAEMLVYIVDDSPIIGVVSWQRGEKYNLEDVITPMHKSHFWDYVLQFPMHHAALPCYMETEFISALAFGSNERVLDVKDTTFPFEDHQIVRLIKVYQDLKEFDRSYNVVPALSWHIARTMFEVESARARYKYGTPVARIYRDKAIPKRTLDVITWDIIIGLLFFGTHTNYRTRLECTIIKGIISLPDFRRLMQSLVAEWADSNLVATVFVSVNVGFLAVPVSITDLQRALSLVSSLCAMASIVTGLYHVWQHREKKDADFEDAKKYIYRLKLIGRRKVKTHKLTSHDLIFTACFLALPLATLQWSVLSFTVAIAAFCIQSIPRSVGRTLLVVLFGLLALLSSGMFLYFWKIWQAPPHREMEEGLNPNVVDDSDPLRWRDRLDVFIESLRGKRKESLGLNIFRRKNGPDTV